MIYQKYFDKIIMVGRLFVLYQIFLPKRHGFSNDSQCSSIGCTDNAFFMNSIYKHFHRNLYLCTNLRFLTVRRPERPSLKTFKSRLTLKHLQFLYFLYG